MKAVSDLPVDFSIVSSLDLHHRRQHFLTIGEKIDQKLVYKVRVFNNKKINIEI